MGDACDKDKVANTIKLWFDGYSVGNHLIYNISSVMNCLEWSVSHPTNAFHPYLTATVENELIKDTLVKLKCSIDNSLDNLMANNATCLPIDLKTNLEGLNDVNPQPEDFFSLLLHTGYLTRMQENIYKIPNIEIKQYFYNDLLPTWINNESNTSLHGSVIDNLADSIEDGKTYSNVIKFKLLGKLRDVGENWAPDFRALLGGFSSIANIFHLAHAKHDSHSGVPVRETAIDSMFTPLVGKSETVIIQQYNVLNNMNGVDEFLEDLLWEICGERFIREVIDQFQQDDRNKHWKKIIIRVLVFFRNEPNRSWSMKMREHVYSMAQAQQLDETFANEGAALLNDYDKLFGETESQVKQAAREHFLKEKNFASLDLLLKSFFWYVHNPKNKRSFLLSF